MSPRAPDPRVRAALIDAAAKLLIEHGPDGLTTRRLAAEVGASTMAVYTYFRGMEELRLEVCREGFRRLAAYLDGVRRTDDPVADVGVLGGAYFINAIANSHLYRFMFLEPVDAKDPDVGHDTFERLVAGVQRAVDAGRFAKADPWLLARQLWATAHGLVTLHQAQLLTIQEALECFAAMGTNLFVAFGDARDAAQASIIKAQTRIFADEAGEIALAGLPA